MTYNVGKRKQEEKRTNIINLVKGSGVDLIVMQELFHQSHPTEDIARNWGEEIGFDSRFTDKAAIIINNELLSFKYEPTLHLGNRVMVAHMVYNQSFEFYCVCVYAPVGPTENAKFWLDFQELKFHTFVVVLGDCNNLINPLVDIIGLSKKNRSGPRNFCRALLNMNLQDSFVSKSNKFKYMTRVSKTKTSTGNYGSYIDYIIVRNMLFENIKGLRVIISALSDHRPLAAYLEIPIGQQYEAPLMTFPKPV
ncbi:hypothetical protein DSO57_1030718 [Entomophthora muscae]|uniref:Uncharacterized protein n=1 Tax=Entomophthora muscae TaxID=34485 RepID=A0ACC2UAI6_9FUNG|nr:hypothetical protein DSO57_1030718 [Entomophthora muscae]